MFKCVECDFEDVECEGDVCDECASSYEGEDEDDSFEEDNKGWLT